MPGNARKKERLGGVSGGKGEMTHYACKGRERRRGGEALPRWELMQGIKREERGRLGVRAEVPPQPRRVHTSVTVLVGWGSVQSKGADVHGMGVACGKR